MTGAKIDAAIRRHADSELLYDRAYEDSGRFVSPDPSPSKASLLTARWHLRAAPSMAQAQ